MHVLVLVPGCAVVWRGCVMVKCCAGMAWTICSEGEVHDRGGGKATRLHICGWVCAHGRGELSDWHDGGVSKSGNCKGKEQATARNLMMGGFVYVFGKWRSGTRTRKVLLLYKNMCVKGKASARSGTRTAPALSCTLLTFGHAVAG